MSARAIVFLGGRPSYGGFLEGEDGKIFSHALTKRYGTSMGLQSELIVAPRLEIGRAHV